MTVATIDIADLLYTEEGFRDGRPCLAGTGITVHRIAADYLDGMTPEEIHEARPHASLASIHAALAYFHAHRDQVLADFEVDAAWGEEQARALGAEIL